MADIHATLIHEPALSAEYFFVPGSRYSEAQLRDFGAVIVDISEMQRKYYAWSNTLHTQSFSDLKDVPALKQQIDTELAKQDGDPDRRFAVFEAHSQMKAVDLFGSVQRLGDWAALTSRRERVSGLIEGSLGVESDWEEISFRHANSVCTPVSTLHRKFAAIEQPSPDILRATVNSTVLDYPLYGAYAIRKGADPVKCDLGIRERAEYILDLSNMQGRAFAERFLRRKVPEEREHLLVQQALIGQRACTWLRPVCAVYYAYRKPSSTS
jgi:hypothetical protein